MNSLKTFLFVGAMMFATGLQAQELSVRDKTVKVEDLPEYIVINCDNSTGLIGSTIRITIQSKNSEFAKPLNDLSDLFEKTKYLNVSNQTDLLNAMSKLGFEYINAFPQNSGAGSSYSRSGFVFRKKEKYRN